MCWVTCTYTRDHYTEKTIFPIPLTFDGIWSWWQFSFRFWTKQNSIKWRMNIDRFPFDFEKNGVPFCSKSKGKLSLRSYPIQFKRKTVTTIISHSICKENCHHDHIPFKLNGKLSPRSYPIQFKRKTIHYTHLLLIHILVCCIKLMSFIFFGVFPKVNMVTMKH